MSGLQSKTSIGNIGGLSQSAIQDLIDAAIAANPSTSIKDYLFEDSSCGFTGKNLDFSTYLYYEFVIIAYATGFSSSYRVNGKTLDGGGLGAYSQISLLVNQSSGIFRNRYDNQTSMVLGEGGVTSSQAIIVTGKIYRSALDNDIRIETQSGDDRTMGFVSSRINGETSVASFQPTSAHTGLDADSKIIVWGVKKIAS